MRHADTDDLGALLVCQRFKFDIPVTALPVIKIPFEAREGLFVKYSQISKKAIKILHKIQGNISSLTKGVYKNMT
jgi:hypothetical protein